MQHVLDLTFTAGVNRLQDKSLLEEMVFQ